MMPVPPDSHKISLKIIEAIKQHPVLYSTEVRGPSIKLQDFRQKVWKRISDELGLDPTWVRLKWKNLRDTYCRILKYKVKTEEGVRRKKWIFEDHLSFLKFPHESDYQPQCVELTEEYIQDINAGGISSEGLLEQLEDRNDEDYSEYLEVLEETTADPILESEMVETYKSNGRQQLATQKTAINSQESTQRNIDSYAQEIQSKYRKIRPKRTKSLASTSSVPNSYSILKPNSANTLLDANTITNPILVTSSVLTPVTTGPTAVEESGNAKEDINQTYLSENKSSIELFFASMAQTVKKFPAKMQADIKMNICKIVTEAEMRYSAQITTQTTQQFITPPGMIPKLVLIPCNKLDNQGIKDCCPKKSEYLLEYKKVRHNRFPKVVKWLHILQQVTKVSKLTKMLRHLTCGKGHVSFLKHCSAIQLVINPSRKQCSEAKDKDEDINKYRNFNDTTIASKKMLKSLKQDWSSLKKLKKIFSNDTLLSDLEIKWRKADYIPYQCDVLIIGGGAIGSSIAYWLKKMIHRDEFNVGVIEKDPTYAKASTTLSVGGLRQQFSLEENIEMSLYGAEFLRNINEYLSIPYENPIDINFHPYGYLILASEKGAETLVNNSKLQNSLGAKNVVLTQEKLKRMFPWLNTDGIAAGCLGLEKEGWFDPWSLLCALKNKANYLGAHYINGEVKAFQYRIIPGAYDNDMEPVKKLDEVVIETSNGEIKKIQFCMCVIAAGAFSGDVAELADIGTGEGILSVPLPVVPRKRYVYCFHSPNGPGLNTPLTIDTNGTYFRRDGLAGNFIGGKSPELHEEPSVNNLDVDHEYFDNKVWPALAHRVPAFENLKVKSSWAGYYEYNTFDGNGIIGQHPYHKNLFMATGFSGHGIQKAPAVGRAIAELILYNRYVSIDLSKLSFQRFLDSEPMKEANMF
ncbi:FAD-dependent oxidoreductase domain-containing protein 1-like [Odontomachus brunneus]|uniref:FAD-dependent oxidoreductase domain-containing protein 1-like n=1 Tax=Odontomachus brunneus TaxID=486640 RepID=UPI0013F2AF75|nr:FAD-dependent oxidoreductase domain-containing protein 1-like [Odontomachus brunneus]